MNAHSFIATMLAVIGLGLMPIAGVAQGVDPDAPLPTGGKTSRPVQAGAVPPPMEAAAPLTLSEVSEKMQSRLLKLPSVRAVTEMPGAPTILRLIAHNESMVGLSNLLGRLNAPGSDREAEYRRLETNIAMMLARTDPFKPDNLRVVIRTNEAINAFEGESAAQGIPNSVVRRPFLGELEEVVVGDTPSTIALMPTTRLADLGLSPEQAFERARANTQMQIAALAWQSVNGLLEVAEPSGYETSLLAFDDIWTNVEAKLGGPIAVIVPTRDKIIVGRADKSDDLARMQDILNDKAKGAGLLSAKIWVRAEGKWIER
jgi:hypothetical protein